MTDRKEISTKEKDEHMNNPHDQRYVDIYFNQLP